MVIDRTGDRIRISIAQQLWTWKTWQAQLLGSLPGVQHWGRLHAPVHTGWTVGYAYTTA